GMKGHGDSVARGVEPLAAAARALPALEVEAPRVLAEKQVRVLLRVGDRLRTHARRPHDMGLAAVMELGLVALLAADRTGDQKHCRTSVCHGRGDAFVDQPPGDEAVEPERRRDRMRPVVGYGVGEDEPGARYRLEATGSPAAIDVQAPYVGQRDDRTAV